MHSYSRICDGLNLPAFADDVAHNLVDGHMYCTVQVALSSSIWSYLRAISGSQVLLKIECFFSSLRYNKLLAMPLAWGARKLAPPTYSTALACWGRCPQTPISLIMSFPPPSIL